MAAPTATSKVKEVEEEQVTRMEGGVMGDDLEEPGCMWPPSKVGSRVKEELGHLETIQAAGPWNSSSLIWKSSEREGARINMEE